MELRLKPREEDFYSWYELHLLAEQTRHQQEREWNHTRHIMAALGGAKPQAIISLPTIDKPRQGETATPQDAQRILEKYKHRLTPVT